MVNRAFPCAHPGNLTEQIGRRLHLAATIGNSCAMIAPLFRCDLPVTLVGGSPLADGVLSAARAVAPRVVAADGGADRALAAGVMPEAVIGDMDSISDVARARVGAARLHAIAEQESTDFDKCLRSIEAPLVVAVGFDGHRMDHALAAFNTLARHPDRACVILGAGDVAFLAPARPLAL